MTSNNKIIQLHDGLQCKNIIHQPFLATEFGPLTISETPVQVYRTWYAHLKVRRHLKYEKAKRISTPVRFQCYLFWMKVSFLVAVVERASDPANYVLIWVPQAPTIKMHARSTTHSWKLKPIRAMECGKLFETIICIGQLLRGPIQRWQSTMDCWACMLFDCGGLWNPD